MSSKTKCGKAVDTTDNETKWGKAFGKQLTASEYCMCRGTMDSKYFRDKDCRSYKSDTNCRMYFLDLKIRRVNQEH